MEIEEQELTSQGIGSLFRESDKALKDLEGVFIGPCGKIIESLEDNGILPLLKERGIAITEIYREVKRWFNKRLMQLDFLLMNDGHLVVGKVRTALRAEDVVNFLEELAEFLDFFPKYRGYKIYGAVIGIRIDEAADRFAYHKGLFVFKVGGEGMLRILNDETFKPKDFGS